MPKYSKSLKYCPYERNILLVSLKNSINQSRYKCTISSFQLYRVISYNFNTNLGVFFPPSAVGQEFYEFPN
jgi:hypothetical protein